MDESHKDMDEEVQIILGWIYSKEDRNEKIKFM